MPLRHVLPLIAAVIMLSPAVGVAQSSYGFPNQSAVSARPVHSVYHTGAGYRVATGHGGIGANYGCEAQTYHSPYVNFDGCPTCNTCRPGIISSVVTDIDCSLNRLVSCVTSCGHSHCAAARPSCGCAACCPCPLREGAKKLLSLFRCNHSCCATCGLNSCGGCGVDGVHPLPMPHSDQGSPFLDDPDGPPRPPLGEAADRYPNSGYQRAKELWPQLQPPHPDRAALEPTPAIRYVKQTTYTASAADRPAATTKPTLVNKPVASDSTPNSTAANSIVPVAPVVTPAALPSAPKNPLRD